jgi:hypothetical protein
MEDVLVAREMLAAADKAAPESAPDGLRAAPGPQEVEAAARALWKMGNARIGERPWEAVCAHYIAEATVALEAARAALGSAPPDRLRAALQRIHALGHDWNAQKLRDVARWANGFVWKRAPFADYDRHRRNAPQEQYDEQQGLFV